MPDVATFRKRILPRADLAFAVYSGPTGSVCSGPWRSGMAGESLDERARRYAEIKALMAAQDWEPAIAHCIQLLASEPLDEEVDALLTRCRQGLRARQQQTIRLPRPNRVTEGSLRARTQDREQADRAERGEAD